MNNINPLLSIVVPTKNRYKYLIHLIKLIKSFGSNEIELVIQDNSDNNDEIMDFLSNEKSENIKYFYQSEKLSMSKNSDFAILNSKGEYVCFIGDDDGVCHNILECVKWMKKNNIEALRSRRASFVWGDSIKNPKKINNATDCVLYNKPSAKFTYLNPKKELDNILRKGFQSIDFIPIVYNGIVKRSILDNVFEIGKTFFPGGSPDISNGVVLSFFVNKMVFVDFPIIISGTSKMTGGGIHKQKGQSVPLEKVDFIERSVVENWERDFPKIWAGRLAWPESGIKALRYVNQPEYIKKLNKNYMFAAFSLYFLQYKKIGYKYAPNKFYFIFYFIFLLFSNGVRVIKNKIISCILRKKYAGRFIKRNITDIETAASFLTSIVKDFDFYKLKYYKSK